MDEGYPLGSFAKLDDEEDELFYGPPRLVYHIDESAVAALTEFYRNVLPAGGVLLDVMSSWVSHLPPEVSYAEVIGHGMNAADSSPTRGSAVGSYRTSTATPSCLWRFQRRCGDDLRVNSVSAKARHRAARGRARVEARRADRHQLLEPLLLDQSRPVWRALDDDGHARLVERYLRDAGFERVETHRLAESVEDARDPMIAVVGHKQQPAA